MPATKLFLLCVTLSTIAQPAIAAAEEDVGFNSHVRAILSEHCFECHGPDANNRHADLRLDVEEDAKLSAIVPGDSLASELMARVSSTDPNLVMPPPDAKKTLTTNQIDTLKQWIDAGANYEKHWSFLPIANPEIPAEAQEANAIDYFVRQSLSSHRLEPSLPADKATLLRRVSLDLTGLPPTPSLLSEFLADSSPNAYEAIVDRLLQSKHYGEHMAMPWLEAARYADTSGYQADWERFMWPWRTWVIESFNNNMPFDQFTVEQIAGDMLPNASRSQILATGFNRNHRINDEGGVIAAEYAVEYVVDRIDTTSTVWLGLTMGCCRCHDHKYDPLPQQDFYNMFALFNNVPEKGKDGRTGFALPILDVPNPAVTEEINSLLAAKKVATKALTAAAAADFELQDSWLVALRKQLAETPENRWQVLKPVTAKGTGGVELQFLEDGSLLRDGANPATTTYSLTISADDLANAAGTELTAFQLEALTDPSLTNNSLAPSENGNFVLSEFKAEILRGKQKLPLRFASAIADHSQANYPAEFAIDGKPKTGWAVEGHVRKENRKLLLTLTEPLVPQPGDRLRMQLQHSSSFAQHVIGRFRISATESQFPTLDGTSPHSPDLMAALQAAAPNRDQNTILTQYFQETHPAFTAQRKAIEAIEKKISKKKASQFVKVMVMSEMDSPRQTYVLDRGAYDQPNKDRPAIPNAPSVLGGLGSRTNNRLGFAEWLVSDSHPLTARVTVNRFWQQFFGRGIVETVEDFGSQGTLPSHPELLDWLANDFREGGWNVKRLIKQFVTSDTYKQSSVVTDAQLEHDPKNIWLARTSRLRLSGYQLRDQALAASGLMVRTLGGPSVRPYQPPGLWSEVSFQQKSRSTDFYVQDHGDKLYRRGLYTFWKRSVAPPMLANFDAAGRETCTVRANRTSTPLQALNLMNDVTFVEAARAMGQRMLHEGGDSVQEQLAFGFRLLGLNPSAARLNRLVASHNRYQKCFAPAPEAAADFLKNGEWAHDASLNQTELAAMSAIASIILNLDEVIVRQ